MLFPEQQDMFYTCTSMIRTRLYHRHMRTNRFTKNLYRDLDLHAQHTLFFFFKSFLAFVSVRLISASVAFEKLLNCIRQEGKSFFFLKKKKRGGRLLLKVKPDSA